MQERLDQGVPPAVLACLAGGAAVPDGLLAGRAGSRSASCRDMSVGRPDAWAQSVLSWAMAHGMVFHGARVDMAQSVEGTGHTHTHAHTDSGEVQEGWKLSAELRRIPWRTTGIAFLHPRRGHDHSTAAESLPPPQRPEQQDSFR